MAASVPMHGVLCAPQYGVHCPLPPSTDNPADAFRTRQPTQAERAGLRALRESVAADCRRLYANPPRGVWIPFKG